MMNVLNDTNLPKHIAFIMDGNGRWAQKRLMPRTVGHQAGLEAMRRVIRKCGALGIQVVTFYTFSTENWKRNPQEVEFLMKLPIEFIEQDLPELMKNGSRLLLSGRSEGVPEKTMNAILRGVEATKHNQGLIINLAFNYGGRDELIRAVHKIIKDLQISKITLESIDETLLHSYLDQPLIPDPDLIIRTGGEQRLSNFLLWESAYAELYFAKEFWPEMTGDLVEKILFDYVSRNRRFGGI